MKNLFVVALFICSSAFAITGDDIEMGLKNKTLKMKKVRSSKWLDKRAQELEYTWDFHENISYVGEDWEEVISTCDFSEETAENVWDAFSVSAYIDWNKVVSKKRRPGQRFGKTRTEAYILNLYAYINSPSGTCMYQRGTYAIDKKGKVIELDETKYIDRYFQENNPTEY